MGMGIGMGMGMGPVVESLTTVRFKVGLHYGVQDTPVRIIN